MQKSLLLFFANLWLLFQLTICEEAALSSSSNESSFSTPLSKEVRTMLEMKKNYTEHCIKSHGKGSDAYWDGACYCISGYTWSENQCFPGEDVVLTQELIEAWPDDEHLLPSLHAACFSLEDCTRSLAQRLQPGLSVLHNCRARLIQLDAAVHDVGSRARAEEAAQARPTRMLQGQSMNLVAMNERLLIELRRNERLGADKEGLRQRLHALSEQTRQLREQIEELRAETEEQRRSKDRYLIEQTQRLDRCEDATVAAREAYEQHGITPPLHTVH